MEKLLNRLHSVKKRTWIIIVVVVSLLLVLITMYLMFVYSNLPFIKKWRTIYIETAMSTYTHKWLATAFIPEDVVNDVMNEASIQQEEQQDLQSSWPDIDDTEPDISTDEQQGEGDTDSGTEPPDDGGNSVNTGFPALEGRPMELIKTKFYRQYWELDEDGFETFLKRNPEYLEDGYFGIVIEDTDMSLGLETTMGERICVLDAVNNLMVVEVTGSGYNGRLAIVKDPSQVGLVKSSYLGVQGEQLSSLGSKNGAILAINASGFFDEGGVGTGGRVVGATIIDGVEYGYPDSSLKLFGIKTDNKFYIENYNSNETENYRWAVQFSPALIVDGQQYVDGSYGFGIQPRTAIGQTLTGEMLLLIVDGRQVGHSLGCTVSDLCDVMLRHNAYQAMNIDGGSSSLMWYNGTLLTKTSSPQTGGRYLPNAIVVFPAENEDE